MSSNIVLRVQSPEHGTRRIQSTASEKVAEFLDKVQAEFGLPDVGWQIFKNRDKSTEIRTSRSRVLSQYKLNHGDMLYLHQASTAEKNLSSNANMEYSDPRPSSGEVATKSTTNNSQALTKSDLINVKEDDVDQLLSKMDGRIPRSRNEQYCRHGPSGKCFHCVPLEPYDETYLKSADPPIKFLSFHSYIRKLTGGVDKGKFAMLENISCRIKPGCKEHPPWPGGICTKCQPNAVTLNRQIYRHVDYIQFENPFLMEKFLNYWRSTGNQRIGIMYGRYEHHKDVPLGIKAVVAAIYEPPQESTKNSIQLLPDDKEETVKSIAAQLGLCAVGWVFTDLIAKDLTNGTVKHVRGHLDAHFLSAEECITAADFQNRHPNPCKLSPDGHFGSKFVTVVVTGDVNNQIHFEGYQVSNQCMALVKDECLVPTKDVPELGYIKQSSNDQYVPDVFYKEKDVYGNEVTQLARPLPVEYLLVDIPAAFPVDPVFTFHGADAYKPFAIENRSQIGELQEFNAFSSYIQQFPKDKLLDAMSDFHLLLFMATCDMLPVKDEMEDVFKAVKDKNEETLYHWSKSEHWATVEQLMHAHVPSPPLSRQGSYVGPNPQPLPPIGSSTGLTWTCTHCTFINLAATAACEMCSLPKA